MNRIDRIFQDLRQRGGKALMPFITAGDPDLATTAQLLPALEQGGASVVELGIPFSDPVADGPVIQESMNRALASGVRVRRVFDMVAQVRPTVTIGLVAMVSYSIVHRIGPAAFVRDAAAAGIDGLIVPDLPLEASSAVAGPTHDAGLILSMLVAPTTPTQRAQRIARASTGFVYVVSRPGITGESDALPPELPERIDRLREATDLPVTVGFGISTRRQVAQVVQVADAAIVGSALVRRIVAYRDAPAAELAGHVTEFTRDLAAGLPPRAKMPDDKHIRQA